MKQIVWEARDSGLFLVTDARQLAKVHAHGTALIFSFLRNFYCFFGFSDFLFSSFAESPLHIPTENGFKNCLIIFSSNNYFRGDLLRKCLEHSRMQNVCLSRLAPSGKAVCPLAVQMSCVTEWKVSVRSKKNSFFATHPIMRAPLGCLILTL